MCTCRRSQSAAGSASTPLESLPLLQQQSTSQQHTDHQKLQEQAQQAKAQTHSKLHSKGEKDGTADGANPAENLSAHADEAAGMASSAGTVVASVPGQQCLCPCYKDCSYFHASPLSKHCIRQGFDLACAIIIGTAVCKNCTMSVLQVILSFSSDSMDLYAADVQIAYMTSRLAA